MRFPKLLSFFLTLSLSISPQVVLAQVLLAQTPSRNSGSESADSNETLVRRANEAERAGRCDEAERIWLGIIRGLRQDDLNLAPSYNSAGNALLCQNKLDAALEAYQRSLRLAGDSPNRAYPQAGIGYVWYQKGQLDQAIAAFREAIQIKPDYHELYVRLGDALYLNRQLEDAIAIYRRAIQSDSQDGRAFVGLGNALDDLGHQRRDRNLLTQAIAAYQQAITIRPNESAYVEMAVALKRQNRLDEAIAACNQAIRLNPNYSKAFQVMGAALLTQGKTSEAVAALDQALQLNPNSSSAYEGLIAAYRMIVQRNPENAYAWVVLGNYLSAQDRSDESIAAYTQALEISRNDSTRAAEAYNGIGRVYLSQAQRTQGQIDQTLLNQAAEAFQNALDRNPNYAFAHNNLASVFILQDKLDEATEAFKQALASPDQQGYPTTAHALAHNGLGLVYQRQENYSQAIAEFSSAIRQDANFQTAQSNLVATQSLMNRTGNSEVIPSRQEDPLVHIKRSVVFVLSNSLLDGTGFGTGWVIKREGDKAWIVTNRHVVLNAQTGKPSEQFAVELYSKSPTRTRLPARLIQFSRDKDIALLEVTGMPEDIEPLQISLAAPSDETLVRTIGHPYLATAQRFLYWNVAGGAISNTLSPDELAISGLDSGGGASGSPILDKRTNQVIGLLQGGDSFDRGGEVVFALPMSYLANDLRAWGML